MNDKRSIKSSGNLQPAGKRPLQIIKQLHYYAYKKWPGIISSPARKPELQRWRANDRVENEKTEPPSEEQISLACMWAIEFFTPSHIQALINGLAKLGWDEDQFGRNTNPIVWVQQSRESSQSAGWMNLGVIVRPEEKQKYIMSTRTAPLPDNVEYASACIFHLTPSLTCVVIGFVFDQESSLLFDNALRKKRETYFRPKGLGFSIVEPFHQKQEAVAQIRKTLRTSATAWFRENLPGFFSSLGGESATCELTIMTHGEPYSNPSPGPSQYFRVLDMESGIDAWEWNEAPALKFSRKLFGDRDGQSHAIMAVNKNSLPAKELEMYGRKENRAVINYIESHTRDLLSRWALLPLLSAFDRYLNTLRDSADIKPSNRQRVLRLLKAFGAHLSRSGDIAAVASELRNLASREQSFLYEVTKFTPISARLHGRETTLGEMLRANVEARATSVEKTDRLVRDLMLQYGSLIGAVENIKLQRTIRFLTWVLVVLTVVLVAVALRGSG